MTTDLKLCALATVLSLLGCEKSQSCTLIGCESGFSWVLHSPLGPDVLADAKVELCHNEVCVAGAAVRADSRPGIGTVITLMNTAGDRVDFTVFRDGSDPIELEVYWYLRASEARDGDVYTLALTDAQGTVLLDKSHTVAAYQSSYPNGKRCDDEPCRSASRDERPVQGE